MEYLRGTLIYTLGRSQTKTHLSKTSRHYWHSWHSLATKIAVEFLGNSINGPIRLSYA